MRHKFALRRLAVVSVAIAPVALMVCPASSTEDAQGWYLDAVGIYGANPDTYQSSGTLDFKSTQQFAWTGQVRDLCSSTGTGDGYGAAVDIVVDFMNGTSQTFPWALQDTNGCGNAWETGGRIVTTDARIKDVWIVLYETNNGKEVVTVDFSKKKDNPYT